MQKRKRSTDAVLKAEKICKFFQMGESTVRAVDNMSFDIPRGQFVSIVGASGSGKTTLLNLVSCLLRPDNGEVYVNSQPISKMNDNELARIRGKTIGFIFQTFNLIPRLTALENVMLPLWFEGIAGSERERIARGVLEDVGLADRTHHRPTELSGGQRQRVAIARALANDPDVIVADEPTGNLDSKSGTQVLEIISDLHRKKGKTVVMVTHDPKVSTMAGRRLSLFDGKIVKDEKLN